VKLTVFQSDKGDCLLLTGAGGERVLVDGGMSASYAQHVAPALGALRAQGHALDLVYVSHIDEDHIAGVLQLMDDLVAWRVHDFQVANGNPTHKAPKAPRPPEVKAIWNNAFHDQVGRNSGKIEDMLAASAAVLSGTEDEALKDVAQRHQDLANSIPEALQLSHRIADGQLGIPLNGPFGNRLAMVRPAAGPVAVGALQLFVLAPFEADLKKLRAEWNKWLKANGEVVQTIRRKAREDQDLLGNEVVRLMARLVAEAKVLGNRKKVTAPNLASLMLLAEEQGKTVLLTGDGHRDDILKGLAHQQKLDAQGRLHVDVLKVQHHGSEHNIDEAFCRAVTADDYVFCGNGAHLNPDLDVVETLVTARLAVDPRPFKLWFNSSSAVPGKAADRAQMKKVEDLVARLVAAAPAGRVQSSFLQQSSFELPV
jgi:beta-lactamase superfamily II metal-dependent hydrolase